VIRAALAAALVAFALAWIAYVHLWRHGDARPLRYRDASAELRGYQTPHAVTSVFRGRDGGTTLLVASGPRSSTAYALDVVRAVEERGRAIVTLHVSGPTLAKPGRAQITYPYLLLLFPRLDKPVYVHVEGRP
jgi:hypothetical protein